MLVGQYIGVFNQTGWSTRFREEMPLHLLTRLYLAFALIDKDGLYWEDEAKVLQVLQQLRRVNPKAEVFASVQDDLGLLRGAFDPGFPKKVLLFLQKYQLDGLDLDWEENLEERALSHLVEHLSRLLRLAKMKLTLAAWPFWMRAYNASVLRVHLDQINLMSYGAGLNLSEVVDDFVSHGFPPELLIGGVSTEWSDSLGDDGSIAEKVRTARERNLTGMMAWRLDNDYGMDETPSYKGAHQLWNSARP